MLAHWPMAMKILALFAMALAGGWIGYRLESWQRNRKR